MQLGAIKGGRGVQAHGGILGPHAVVGAMVALWSGQCSVGSQQDPHNPKATWSVLGLR